MDVKTAKSIRISEFLQRLGCDLVKTLGGCKWYRSPMRTEKTPSFKLTHDANGWYDHGTGEGGNILDLAYRLHSGIPLVGKLESHHIREALAFIENVMGVRSIPTLPIQRSQPTRSGLHTFTLVNHVPFAIYSQEGSMTKSAIYLNSRGVDAKRVAPYLEDIIFVGSDGKKHYGFGLLNVSGGYEIRRYGDWAKRSIGTKDITIFRADREMAPWHTFYSLIDFCTFITVDKPPIGVYNYLIINSDSLADKAIVYLEGLPAGFMIHYPHGDESGQRAYHKLVGFLANRAWISRNKAHLYTGFKDWTEARERQLDLKKIPA